MNKKVEEELFQTKYKFQKNPLGNAFLILSILFNTNKFVGYSFIYFNLLKFIFILLL